MTTPTHYTRPTRPNGLMCVGGWVGVCVSKQTGKTSWSGMHTVHIHAHERPKKKRETDKHRTSHQTDKAHKRRQRHSRSLRSHIRKRQINKSAFFLPAGQHAECTSAPEAKIRTDCKGYGMITAHRAQHAQRTVPGNAPEN